MTQKENLEYYAIINFIREYNQTHKKQFAFGALHRPPMPDAFCKLHKRKIGIEVVHSYGTDEEAAIRLGNRESSHYSKEIHLKRRMTPVDIRALGSLNRRLGKKAEKQYSFSPVWLLIRNGFSLWGLSDYKKNKSRIYVPENHPFNQIWILCDGNSVGVSGILRIA
ncbi:hypothetical protein DSCW_08620 [Desulfosarcina widdelii]|uniref:Uncharacterized protein n=1 Tax=Desulfosarcina widdelii TaxID=947919 RepID=A0A5K7YYE6_9BACT|nr:hypothetical protein [Desulfosarcina widdelii]BBO73445.1 hypothetical protein DSCW_08620 [Desulfosarcina widdelii]